MVYLPKHTRVRIHGGTLQGAIGVIKGHVTENGEVLYRVTVDFEGFLIPADRVEPLQKVLKPDF
jgi:hypothetical protein